jgi:ABC-type amino acid transport substrate-binding protein
MNDRICSALIAVQDFFQHLRPRLPGGWLVITFMVLAAVLGRSADLPAPKGAVLRVGVAPVSPPMIFKEGKNIVGLEADLAQALGRELGRPVHFVELPWESLLDALGEDKIDIVMSSVSITRGRQFRVAFSEPYLRVGQMALVRADEKFRYLVFKDSLAKQVIGVKPGTTADLLVQQEYPRAKRKHFKTGEEAAKALLNKKIDLYFSDSTLVWYLAGVYEGQGLTVAPTVLTDELLGWAMRRSDESLRASVNAFLSHAKENGELNRMTLRWIPKFQ